MENILFDVHVSSHSIWHSLIFHKLNTCLYRSIILLFTFLYPFSCLKKFMRSFSSRYMQIVRNSSPKIIQNVEKLFIFKTNQFFAYSSKVLQFTWHNSEGTNPERFLCSSNDECDVGLCSHWIVVPLRIIRYFGYICQIRC